MASKAQTEIMGLVIVVILIALGVLFALRFSLSDDKTDIREEVVESELAAHMLNAMVSTTTSCNNRNPITLAELYQDCSLTNRIRCDSGRNACEEAKNITTIMLQETLNVWKEKYHFQMAGSASQTAKLALNITNTVSGCGRLFERKAIPLPTQVGTVILQLDICK
ncbi:hypothetical protein J4410_04125 [Candidatus Woesearchaeota archaeon]|nr:hypothetical protein [Candidatus Woesearchaeota archaeon]